MIFNIEKNNKAFTAMELLIVVGILSMLAVLVFVVISPGDQISTSRELLREAHLSALDRAILDYQVTHGSLGSISNLSENFTEICNTNLENYDCIDLVDLSSVYYRGVPIDPMGAINVYGTGYEIALIDGKIQTRSAKSENRINRFFSYIYGSFNNSLNLNNYSAKVIVYPESGAVATLRKDIYIDSGSVAIEESTINLWANTNGRPNSLSPGGSNPPTVELIEMETPWGSQVYRVTIPANSGSGYSASRAITNSASYNDENSYSYFSYIKGDLEGITVYPTGSCALASLVNNPEKNIGDWIYRGRENQNFTQACPHPTGSIYNTFYASQSRDYPRTFYVAANQLEAKAMSTSYTQGSRGNGRLRYDIVDGLSELSLMFWVYPTNWDQAGTWDNYFFDTRLNATNHMYLAKRDGKLYLDGSFSGSIYSGESPLTNNDWFHLGVTVDYNSNQNETTIKMYLNGEVAGSRTNSGPPIVLDGILDIGNRYGSSDSRQPGLFDELIVLPYALTEQEVVELYNSQKR